jgi:hypothetical protein
MMSVAYAAEGVAEAGAAAGEAGAAGGGGEAVAVGADEAAAVGAGDSVPFEFSGGGMEGAGSLDAAGGASAGDLLRGVSSTASDASKLYSLYAATQEKKTLRSAPPCARRRARLQGAIRSPLERAARRRSRRVPVGSPWCAA